MKLFTKSIDKELFAQYEKGSNLENQKVIAKIFNPYGRGTWYILNSDPQDPDYLWAIVDLMDVEMGSVSRSELENIKVPPFRLGLERDIYFDPINAKELYDGLMQGKTYEKGGEIKKGDYVIVDNPNWKAAMGIEKPVRRKVTMVIDDSVFFVDGSNSQMKYVKKMAEGGEVGDGAVVKEINQIGVIKKIEDGKYHLKFVDGSEKTYDASELKFLESDDEYEHGGKVGDENKEMLLNRAEGFEHHAEELEAAAKKADHVPAWVVAKAERASSDLSDITHYLDGENEQKREMKEGEEKYAEGGEIKSFDVTFYKEIKRRDGEKVEILRDREDYKGSLKEVMSKALSDFQPMDVYANIKENGKDGIVAKVKSDGSGKIFSKNYGIEESEIKVEKVVEEKKEEEPKKKLFGIFAKGGGIYSSDDIYLVEVFVDDKIVEIQRIRAKNQREANEMVEDMLSDLTKKYGATRIRISPAPSKNEKGGMMEKGGEFGTDKNKIYFSSFAEVMEAIHDIAEDNGYEVKEIFPDLSYGGVGYGETKRAKVELEWNGKEKRGKSKVREKNTMNVQIYRMDSGNYELNNYFSYASGGMMAKGGEIQPYILWVSKDGEKRELHGEYKSQRAAEMAMKKLWDNGDYKAMGNKPKKMYEKEGFYAKGGEIEVKVGDMVKSKKGVEGEVYESTGTFFKLKDKYGNKNPKYYSSKDFKSSEIKSMSEGGETDKKWIQKAIKPKKKGALREEAKRLGLIKGDEKLNMEVLKKLEAKGGKTAQRARLAMKLKQFAMGGEVKFEDKVKSVKESLLERKKVPKRLEKDYGKTYSPKEAEDAAKRIVGAQTFRERLEARLKKAKKK